LPLCAVFREKNGHENRLLENYHFDDINSIRNTKWTKNSDGKRVFIK